MSNSTRIEELRKEIENFCSDCDRPDKEQLGEIILSSMALGFNIGLEAPSADRPSDPHDITYINALENRIREFEAKRPQGEWIKDGHHIRCKNCGIYICDKDREGDTYPQNFCPNCGAYMKTAGGERSR